MGTLMGAVQWLNKRADEPKAEWAKDQARVHLKFLQKLKTWQFIMAIGLWLFGFKIILMFVAHLLDFGGLGFDLYASSIDWLGNSVYGFLGMDQKASELFAGSIMVGIVFPVIITFFCQYIPLHLLRDPLPRERVRGLISLLLTGIFYMIINGSGGFFIHGAVLSIPLAYTFFHRIRTDKPSVAFLVTAGVHGVANITVILIKVLILGKEL